jgi:serine/threonine protein kinase
MIMLSEMNDTPCLLQEMGYQFTTKLGEGTGGEVYSAKHLPTAREVAVKVIPFDDRNPKAKITFRKETNLHEQLLKRNSKFLANVIEIIECNEAGYLVMEKYEGDLFDTIMQVGKFDEEAFRAPFVDICRGLKSMHEAKVAHMDIKPENVLIKRKKAYLADFGNSVQLGKVAGATCGVRGTRRYSAPEIMTAPAEPYNPFSADIFSLGILAHVALTGYFPYLPDAGEHVCDLQYLESIVSSECYQLVSAMLNSNPGLRPTINQILQHKWIAPKQPKQTFSRRVRRSISSLRMGSKK